MQLWTSFLLVGQVNFLNDDGNKRAASPCRRGVPDTCWTCSLWAARPIVIVEGWTGVLEAREAGRDAVMDVTSSIDAIKLSSLALNALGSRALQA